MLLLDQNHWVRRVSTPVSRNLRSRPINLASTVAQRHATESLVLAQSGTCQFRQWLEIDGFLKSCNSRKRKRSGVHAMQDFELDWHPLFAEYFGLGLANRRATLVCREKSWTATVQLLLFVFKLMPFCKERSW